MTDIDTSDATLMRTFDLRGGGVVELYVWQPVRNGEIDTYDTHDCRYLITGLGPAKIRLARGTDALDALTTALQLAASYVYTSEAYKAGDLTYVDSRDLHLPAAPDWRPITDGREKADVLTSGRAPGVVVMPGDRFASIVLPGWLFNSMVAHVRKDTENLAGRDAAAYDIVKRTLENLEAYQDYYERVCRSKGIDLAYKGPDGSDPVAEIPQE